MDPGCRVLFSDERYPAGTTIRNDRNTFIFRVLKALRPFKMSVFTSWNGAVGKTGRLKSSCRDSVFFHAWSSSVKRPHCDANPFFLSSFKFNPYRSTSSHVLQPFPLYQAQCLAQIDMFFYGVWFRVSLNSCYLVAVIEI